MQSHYPMTAPRPRCTHDYYSVARARVCARASLQGAITNRMLWRDG